MGFTPQRKLYHLTFTDPDYAGLEVTMTGLSLGEVLDSMDVADLMDAADRLTKQAAAATTPGEEAAAMRNAKELGERTNQLYADFASHLVSWNVQDETGNPIPADLAGCRTLELGFIQDVMTAWRTAVQGVKPDLSTPSNSGAPALAASLPMEPLSPNPPPWTEPNSSWAAANDSPAYPANF